MARSLPTLKVERERARVSVDDVLAQIKALFPGEPPITARTFSRFEDRYTATPTAQLTGTHLDGKDIRRAINEAERKRLFNLAHPEEPAAPEPEPEPDAPEQEPVSVQEQQEQPEPEPVQPRAGNYGRIPEELRAPTVWQRLADKGIASQEDFSALWLDKKVSYPELLDMTELTEYDLDRAAQELGLPLVKPFDPTEGLTAAQRNNTKYVTASLNLRTRSLAFIRRYNLTREKVRALHDTRRKPDIYKGMGCSQDMWYFILGHLDIPIGARGGWHEYPDNPEPFPPGTPGSFAPDPKPAAVHALPVRILPEPEDSDVLLALRQRKSRLDSDASVVNEAIADLDARIEALNSERAGYVQRQHDLALQQHKVDIALQALESEVPT